MKFRKNKVILFSRVCELQFNYLFIWKSDFVK